MSFVDGTLNSFRVSNKRADYPNDKIAEDATSKTLSISRVYQEIPAFLFTAEAQDTWIDVPGGDIAVPAGTHIIGYKFMTNSDSTGTSVPFTQVRIVDGTGAAVFGTFQTSTGLNNNDTSGPGFSDKWARALIIVASATTYRMQVRRNGSANLNVTSVNGEVTGAMTGDDQNSYVFLDTIAYA